MLKASSRKILPRPPHNLSFFLSYPRGGYGDRGPKWAPFFLFKGWKSELLFVSLGMLERNDMIEALKDKGVHVVGTTQDFGIGGEGIWISGESDPRLFNYYSEEWMDTFGVEPTLNDFAEENGWYFEWHDAGTIMVWPA